MTLTFLLFLILIGLIAFLVLYARWNYGKLDGFGFPVVKPSFLLGSDPEGWKKVQHLQDFERFKKYGNVYGFFEGRSPQVHVCDPELIRLILVKDYDHFTERQRLDFGNPVTNEVMDWQSEPKWKLMRSVITPNFASHRIRDMAECLRELSDEFVEDLGQKFNNNSSEKLRMDFRGFIGSLITKTIEKCYCGIRLENKGESFEILMKNLLKEFTAYDIRHELVRSFPFLIRFHPTVPSEPLATFAQLVRSLIADRKSRSVEKINLQHNFVDILHEFLERKEKIWNEQGIQISENTAVALALEFFLATFDSVSTPIVFMAHYLAQNEARQNRLLQEIDEYLNNSDGDGQELGFQAVSEMPYLQACFQEALRLAPPFFKVERKCGKDWTHKGIKIPKGVTVQIPIWAVNRHPDYYQDPEEFKPERWLKEGNNEKDKGNGNAYAFCTFGHGPKNCVGQRWAYEMGKIIMANFLRKYRFEGSSEVKWKAGSSFILKFETIWFDVVKRDC